MITEKDLCEITNGPISINDFLNGEWQTLFLPNGNGQIYKPTDIDFFTSPDRGDGIFVPQAHLNILISLIRKWKEQLKSEIYSEIYAVFIFGSSVRIPKKIWKSQGWWLWKTNVKVNENIYPRDVDVLVLTNATRQQVAKVRHKQWAFEVVASPSCSWTEWIHTLGFDVNGLTPDEFQQLVGNYEHECQIPNNILKEGVLIAGECAFANLMKNERQVEWSGRLKQCVIK